MKNFNNLRQALMCLALLLVASFSALASSHREAPLISNDPLADNVDLYAFRSPDNPDMVTLIATYVPFQLPQGGPNYYSFGENIRYEIHVDNDASIPGDEITYRFTFTVVNEDPTTFFNIRLGAQNQKTTYTLERSIDGGNSFQTIIENGVVPPNNVGPRSISGGAGLATVYGSLFQNAITQASTGETVFAGPTDDPFFVDLGGIFDLGDAPRQNGTPVDGTACYNVSAIAIQVPISILKKASAPAQPTNILDSDYVIGVWASASRPAMTTLSATANPTYAGDWVQVSRLGMPLTNEAVIPIGSKDYWNSITPYDEIAETTMDEFFYNPELALYMDDDQFGGAVPAFSPLRIQTASLGGFDFTNGADGLYSLKGNPALAGTALDDAVFGTLLLPAAGKPRSVDLWPIFHTGVPNLAPYHLATGKAGNPLANGKPFINNFLPNGGDMLRLNMAVPPTPRDDANFSSLGLVQAAAIGLTVAPFNTNADLEFIPNMDGFPNGRRLEDDVTRIELQAVGGVVLAAVGLWYDDYDATDPAASPVTQDLLNVLTYSTGIEKNDKSFTGSFPFLAMPHSGTGNCSGAVVPNAPGVVSTASIFVSSNNSGMVGAYDVLNTGALQLTPFPSEGADADGIYYDEENDVLYQLNRSANVINAYSNVANSIANGNTPPLTATSSSDFSNGRELTFMGGKLVVAQDANAANGTQNKLVVYNASATAITLDKSYDVGINLWGIQGAGDDLFAIVDVSNRLAVFNNFLANPAGMIAPSMEVEVEGLVRTHGLHYISDLDMMLMTDIGAASSDTDGAYLQLWNFSTTSANGIININEQIRVGGPGSFLGNPVDIDYDETNNIVFVAERANGGGRLLGFNLDSSMEAIPPIYNELFAGASAVTLPGMETAALVAEILATVFTSSNTTGDVGAFNIYENGTPQLTTFMSAGMDADGIYYDQDADVLYQLNRTDNVINAYSNVAASIASGTMPTLTATSTSDFTNGREITVIDGKLVVAQDASATNGDQNTLVVYNASATSITLDKIHNVGINLWGIQAAGTTLFAIVDVSNNVAIFDDFFTESAGPLEPTRIVAVEGLVRTHGLHYISAIDKMLLTDIGAASSPTDGAFLKVENWSIASADDFVSTDEQIRVGGNATLLGNPVDIDIDLENEIIYVAERANGGGHLLGFSIASIGMDGGNIAPTYNEFFAGISAVNLPGVETTPPNNNNNNDDYVIIALDDIILDQNTVNSGGVGSLEENGSANFEDETMINAAGTFVRAAEINIDGSSSVADAQEERAMYTLPEFISNPNVLTNDFEINVGANETVTLGDELYEDVKVGINATVIFSGQENVYIEDLQVSQGATIIFNQCTNLLLSNTMQLGKDVKFNLEQEHVNVYAESVISVKRRTVLYANLYTLNDLKVDRAYYTGQGASLYGTFIAEDVRAREYTNWYFQSFDRCEAPSSTISLANQVGQVNSATGNATITSKDLELSIYPNPVLSNLNLTISSANEFGTMITIVGADGKKYVDEDLTITKGINTLEYNLSSLPSGIYFVMIPKSNGGLISKRFVVQK